MFKRFMTMIKSMLNKGMQKMETPEILAEEAQSDLEGAFKKVREGVTTSITQEKTLEKQIQKNAEEITTWEKRAAISVQQGNDQLARECLQKKQEQNQLAQTLSAQLEEQRKTTATLKARYTELEGKLREFQTKKQNLMARAQAADGMAKARDLISSPSGPGMEKWEAKVQEREIKSQALAEMRGGGPVEDKFKLLDQQSQIDDELAALKANVSKPKLIADKDSQKKEIVDDNLPMVVEEIKDDDKDKK